MHLCDQLIGQLGYELESGIGIDDIPTTFPDIALFEGIRKMAAYIGMPAHEYDNLISWKPKPLDASEKEFFTRLIMLCANEPYADSLTPTEADTQWRRCEELWYKAGASREMQERAVWQHTEVNYFLFHAFHVIASCLYYDPMKVQSGKYDETLKVERTQQDLINEMAMVLSSLPRFTAYAKIIKEWGAEQQVLKHKIYTIPLPFVQRSGDVEAYALEGGHSFCKERVQIEEEIRKRQEKWRIVPSQTSSQPPEEPPPPTKF